MPLIQWSMTQLLKRAIGINQPVLEKEILKPWQRLLGEHLHTTTPTLGSAIQRLKPHLKREVYLGLRTSPLQVFRIVWLVFLSYLPGPQNGTIRNSWPDVVEHLAETMERNLERLQRRQRFQEPLEKKLQIVKMNHVKQSWRSRFWPWGTPTVRFRRIGLS